MYPASEIVSRNRTGQTLQPQPLKLPTLNERLEELLDEELELALLEPDGPDELDGELDEGLEELDGELLDDGRVSSQQHFRITLITLVLTMSWKMNWARHTRLGRSETLHRCSPSTHEYQLRRISRARGSQT